MANSSSPNTTATSKLCLVSARVQLLDSKGEKLEEIGYVMAESKLETINKILVHYSTTDLKVISIPEVEEAKDVSFIIN